ncbi:hypothetical protein PHAVU_006G071100 [Phaseolus vulgaris]|uniref:Uncharacterized protein n=1 Tax=Phaseolus vulgaris TaxID=3885 RepID=V7BLE4_PHAVU|nr:hypothetical protein PHAVU_006G071100g [Phaseolus vulgaris]ESW18799.1 hypothetical protein PHAVU_006G071100g [Phaseolus vulgaris]
MEKIEEGGNTKEKMDLDMDSSSKQVEEFQAEKHDKVPNVEQNLSDPNSKRIVSNHSAKKSRKKKMAKTIKKLEARTEMLQDLHDILKPIAESQKKQMYDLMEEEQALLQEMQYLQEKALLRAENEKNMNRMNMLREHQKMEQEELLMCNIDPLDPEFNEPPSFEDGGSGSQSS